jgi:hypothetical protein
VLQASGGLLISSCSRSTSTQLASEADPSAGTDVDFRSQCPRLRLPRAIPPAARQSLLIELVAVPLNCFDDW